MTSPMGARAAVVTALRQAIDHDRYPLLPRLKPFKSALAKLDPVSAPTYALSVDRCQRRPSAAVGERGDNRCRPEQSETPALDLSG